MNEPNKVLLAIRDLEKALAVATKIEAGEALEEAASNGKDFTINSDSRSAWRKIARLLRAELKEYA